MRRLTRPKEIETAEERLVTRLRKAASYARSQLLGFPGGSFEPPVSWLPSANLWFAYNELDNRYWNAFGLSEPDVGASALSLARSGGPLGGGG